MRILLGDYAGLPEWAERLQPCGQVKTYSADDSILFQGEATQSIGLVLSGGAIGSIYSESGQHVWICHFRHGDLFGHVALLTDTDVNFEIIAETDTQILQVPVNKFREVIASEPDMSEYISRDLAMRLNLMTNRLIEAVTLSAPGRVYAELMRMGRPMGIDPGKLVIRPSPVFVDVALRVSSTRETVSRTVNALLKDGVASREAGAILIHKPETLKAKIK